jgi:hypothetical protein
MGRAKVNMAVPMCRISQYFPPAACSGCANNVFIVCLQDFRLPALSVYKKVAEKLASEQKFNEIQVLLSNAIQTRLMNDKDHDTVVLSLLGMLTDDDKKVRF